MQLERIDSELVAAQRMLDDAIAFDGTVNMTSVTELASQLSAVNSTISQQYYTANRTIALILEEQQMITDSWNKLNILEELAQELLVNLTLAQNDTEEATMIVQIFNSTYTLLRGNLSSLSARYDVLNSQLLLINQMASNVSTTLDNTEVNFNLLVTDVNTSIAEASLALLKAIQLNNTINETQIAIQMAQNNAHGLLVSVVMLTSQCLTTFFTIEPDHKQYS